MSLESTCYRAANWQVIGTTQGVRLGRTNPRARHQSPPTRQYRPVCSGDNTRFVILPAHEEIAHFRAVEGAIELDQIIDHAREVPLSDWMDAQFAEHLTALALCARRAALIRGSDEGICLAGICLPVELRSLAETRR